jgi:cephalosporin-C deacetylase
MKLLKSLVLALLLVCNKLLVSAQVSISTENESAVYAIGDTVKWHITVSNIEKYDSLRYAIKPGSLEATESGMLEIEDSTATLQYVFKKPSSVIIEVRWGNANRFFSRTVSGGICAPDEFKLSSARPDDFDEFWASKIAALKAIPMNSLTTNVAIEDSTIDYFKVQMDNINDSKIRGQLAKPKDGEGLPALLIVQWAGVYPLDKSWVTGRSKEGWLVLNINPHDLPIDNDKEFYTEKSKNELKNYPAIGNDSRDSSYFLRMYLSCYRAVEYLKQHPSWNGKTIVVTGDSQGGQQTVMTAGLHPDITAAMALVPAGFDMLGPVVGRKGGWPQWYNNTEGKEATKVHQASRYFDIVNFVPNIKCPILVGVGLLDETCPPEGIIAGMNQLSSKKQMVYLPKSGHQDRGGTQKLFRTIRDEEWLPKLKIGAGVLE